MSYSAEILHQDERMVVSRQVVDLVAQPGQQVAVMATYAKPGVQLQPLLWIPGYGNGIDDKLPLAHAFADEGIALQVVGQNRAKLLPDPKTGYPDGVGTIASTHADVIHAMGWEDELLPTVGYSNGAQVAAKLVQTASEYDWKLFAEAPLIMLGPTGVVRGDTITRFTLRGLFEVADDNPHPKVRVPDQQLERLAPGGDDLVGVIKVMLQNFPRAVSEYTGVTRQIRLAALARKVGWLSIGLFPCDNLVRPNQVSRTVAPTLASGTVENISLFSAYFAALHDDQGQPVGRRSLNHLTPFKQPRGTAMMVAKEVGARLPYPLVRQQLP
jgi:hypothetical protein